ncbi:MAG: hypothetical protein ACOC7S_00530 [Planctomycetota bacterium]
MSASRLSPVVLAIAVFACAHMAGAQPADDTATCSVQATVADIMEWDSNFAAIDLGTISAQADVLTGSSTVTLFTNGDVSITADTSATAELSEPGSDTLYTEYGLQYDGDGVTATGGADVAYTVYSSFLSGGSAVTHVAGDGAVDVTLQARASNPAGTLGDAGTYSATQTLTASWAGT